jgi:hypothetical protein
MKNEDFSFTGVKGNTILIISTRLHSSYADLLQLGRQKREKILKIRTKDAIFNFRVVISVENISTTSERRAATGVADGLGFITRELLALTGLHPRGEFFNILSHEVASNNLADSQIFGRLDTIPF